MKALDLQGSWMLKPWEFCMLLTANGRTLLIQIPNMTIHNATVVSLLLRVGQTITSAAWHGGGAKYSCRFAGVQALQHIFVNSSTAWVASLERI